MHSTGHCDRMPLRVWAAALALCASVAGAGEAALPHELTNSIAIRLVLVRAGVFLMGFKDGGEHERPVHEVKIAKPFYMGATEVTQAQWEAVMGLNPSRLHRGPNLPVTHVNYAACREFCRRLNLIERAASMLPDRAEYRVPTEAEWEYACRAGSTTKYCFGDDEAMVDKYAWHKGNSGGELHGVAKKEPNAWGLYDMHGNVGEWCRDLYRKYAGGSEADSRGALSNAFRVVRGGGYDDPARICRSSDRCRFPSERRHYSLGLRIVRTVP